MQVHMNWSVGGPLNNLLPTLSELQAKQFRDLKMADFEVINVFSDMRDTSFLSRRIHDIGIVGKLLLTSLSFLG
jgi:hypothetical protein